MLKFLERVVTPVKRQGSGGSPLADVDQGLLAKFMPSGRAGMPAARGTIGLLKAYSTSPWVRATVSKIGDDVGSTRWYLFGLRREGANGKRKWVKESSLQNYPMPCRRGKALSENLQGIDGELVKIEEHPMLRFLTRGNPLFPGHVGIKLWQILLELTGEVFLLLDPMMTETTERIIPEGYWVIPSHWVVRFPTPEFPTWEIQSDYWHGEIPIQGMVRFAHPNPLNPYDRGIGHMRAFGDEIDTDEFASKHIRAWFWNRARPDLLISGTGVDSDEIRRLEAAWVGKVRSFVNAHRPFFMTSKVDVKDLSQKFRDMELSQLRKDERDIIVHGLGLPPEILGMRESANRSTIEAADFHMAKYVTTPRLEFLRVFLQTYIVPWYDDRLILGYESPIEENKAFQLEVMKSRPVFFSSYDWKALAGVDHDDDEVEVWAVDGAVKIVESLEEEEPAPVPTALAPFAGQDNPPALPAGEDDDPMDDDPIDEDKLARALAVKVAAIIEKTLSEAAGRECGHSHEPGPSDAVAVPKWDALGVLKGLPPTTKAIGGEAYQALALKLGEEMADAVVAAFEQLAAEIPVSAIEAAISSGNVSALIYDATAKTQAVFEDAVSVLNQAITIVGTAAAKELATALGTELAFDLTNQRAIDAVNEFGANMVTNVSEETIGALKDMLVDAYENGRTGAQLARDIQKKIGLTRRDVAQLRKLDAALEAQVAAGEVSELYADEFLAKWIKEKVKYRARVIAEHELNKASNLGQEALWQEADAKGLLPTGSIRMWVVTPDDRLCNLCRPMAGETTPVGQPFQTSVGPVATPQDIHVRCRCSQVLAIT